MKTYPSLALFLFIGFAIPSRCQDKTGDKDSAAKKEEMPKEAVNACLGRLTNTYANAHSIVDNIEKDNNSIKKALYNQADIPQTDQANPRMRSRRPLELSNFIDTLSSDNKKLDNNISELKENAASSDPQCANISESIDNSAPSEYRISAALSNLKSQETYLFQDLQQIQDNDKVEQEPAVALASLQREINDAEKLVALANQAIEQALARVQSFKNQLAAQQYRQNAQQSINNQSSNMAMNAANLKIGGINNLASAGNTEGASQKLGNTFDNSAQGGQGRPGQSINDSNALEREADIMGQKALNLKEEKPSAPSPTSTPAPPMAPGPAAAQAQNAPQPGLGQRVKTAALQFGEKASNALGMKSAGSWFGRKLFPGELQQKRDEMASASTGLVAQAARQPGCEGAADLARERDEIMNDPDPQSRQARLHAWQANVADKVALWSPALTSGEQREAVDGYVEAQTSMRNLVQNSLRRNRIPDGVEINAYEAGWRDHIAPDTPLVKAVKDGSPGLLANYHDHAGPRMEDGRILVSTFRSYDGRKTVEELQNHKLSTVTTEKDTALRISKTVVKTEDNEIETKYRYSADNKPLDALVTVKNHEIRTFHALPASNVEPVLAQFRKESLSQDSANRLLNVNPQPSSSNGAPSDSIAANAIYSKAFAPTLSNISVLDSNQLSNLFHGNNLEVGGNSPGSPRISNTVYGAGQGASWNKEMKFFVAYPDSYKFSANTTANAAPPQQINAKDAKVMLSCGDHQMVWANPEDFENGLPCELISLRPIETATPAPPPPTTNPHKA